MTFTIMRDGVLYDALHADITLDIPFYLNAALESGAPILELCCGTGRVTLPLARAGLDIVGLEIDRAMLNRARQKTECGLATVEFIAGDATNFSLGRHFALVISPYNSFQLFHSYAQISSFFECVRQHLAPGGTLVFDIQNPDLPSLAAFSKQRRPDGQVRDTRSAREITIECEHDYNPIRRINTMTFHYSTREQPDFACEQLTQRCFYAEEIAGLIERHGFALMEKYGDFRGKRFDPADRKQVLVCRPR